MKMKKFLTRWLMIIIGWLLILYVAGFVTNLAHGHEGHLSVLKEQTNVSVSPCPQLSGYVVQSDEYGCYLIYKQITISHMAMHYQPLDLDEDGACTCPTIKGED